MRMRPRSRVQMNKGNDLHRWTVSFADFMTLMFAVFVVLYAVSANDKEQYKEVMLSIQNASKLLNKSVFSSNYEGILTKNSNNIIENTGPALLSDDLIAPKDNDVDSTDNESSQASDVLSSIDTFKTGQELNQLKLELESLFDAGKENNNIELDLNGDWLTIEMGGDILFAGGSHTLLNSARDVVKKIAGILKPVKNLLRIRGYSDQEYIKNEIYRSNWELSGMRAFSVLHALNKYGVTEDRMVVEAYGRFSPMLNENNRVDPLKSRRVVIAISKYAVVTVEKNSDLSEDKQIQNKSNPQLTSPKEDSKDIREVYLPNNRLIITTRQE